jgi:uncharacterized protein with PIN domain
MNEVKRITIIKKDHQCEKCKCELTKGSKVIVVASITGRTIKRQYYCFKCNHI